MIAYTHLSPSKIIQDYTTKGAPSTKFWKQAFANIEGIQKYLSITEDETVLKYLDIYTQNLSYDCQTITSPDILDTNDTLISEETEPTSTTEEDQQKPKTTTVPSEQTTNQDNSTELQSLQTKEQEAEKMDDYSDVEITKVEIPNQHRNHRNTRF